MWRILSLIPTVSSNLKDDTPLLPATPSTTFGYTSSTATYFNLEEPMFGQDWYKGLIYDPVSEDFFLNEFYSDVLDQYSKDVDGNYSYLRSYDMGSIGISRVYDIDINRSNGLFYAQAGNSRVVAFSLDELTVVYPVPLPGAALLGMLGLGYAGMRLRKG